MKPSLSLLAAFLLVAAAGAAAQQVRPMAHYPDAPRYVADELIVKFHPQVPAQAKARFNRGQGANVIGELPFGITRLRLPAGASPEAAAALYEKNPNVLYAHPNHIMHAAMVPDDPYFAAYQWHMDNPTYGGIRMTSAWDVGNAGSGTVVAVLDSGIAYENYDANGDGSNDYLLAPDLAGTAFVPGYDFINNDAHPNDDEGHGTHVSGTIAQSTNNGLGVAGVAFNAALMPVKVLDAQGSGTDATLVSGIAYAMEHGADVINMSLSFGTYSGTIPALDDAIAAAYGSGVVIVAASGNDAQSAFVSYPANNPNVVAVGATDFFENVAPYSNRGDRLELTAPGGNTGQDLSAYGYHNGGVLQQTMASGNPLSFAYYYYQGTSMATPHVAGVAALVRDINPALTPDEVRTVLRESAEDHGAAGWDSSYGYGIVDAYAAALLAQNSLIPNEAPTAVISGPSTATEDIAVTFDAAPSSDPDGDVLQYSWDIDGHAYSGVSVTHTFAWGGTLNVALTVSDGKGGIDTATQTIAVTEVNDLPVVDSGGPYSGEAGSAVAFSAAGTTDYDNDDPVSGNDQTLTYRWDFGDGTTAEGVAPSHTYADAATYDVTLSVSDGVDTVTAATTATIVPKAAVIIDQLALADLPVAGTVTGSYLDTHAEDGVLEQISERLSGGKPSSRYTYLEHQWSFSVQPGDLVTLSAALTLPDSGESYAFAYSADGVNFTEMFVAASSGHYSSALPAATSGSLTLRVTDLGRNPGDQTVHTLGVDALLIRTESSGSATTPPAAPSALSAASLSDSEITLTWSDNADNESGFTIARSSDGVTWADVGTAPADATGYSDSGLAAATLYHYRVSAFNAAGSSAAVEASATTQEAPATQPLVAPTALAAAVSGSSVTLTWDDANSDEEGFTIERGTKVIGKIVFDPTPVADTTATTYTDTLGAAGTYYYRVRAYRGTERSDYSATVSARIK